MGASAASMMPEAWRQFVGQVAAGEFPLREYLGGSSGSAVFLTERGDRTAKAAIKLVPLPADSATADLLLARWDLAARLSHVRVLRLFERGRCRLGGAEFLYVVSEFAEEDLSQILPQRALTSAEAGDMLRSLLDALSSLHDQSLVHGRIRPANVMAAADVIKLSSDSLCPAGGSKIASPPSIPPSISSSIYDAPELATSTLSPAADLWSLSVLLVETLTQRLPVSKPGQSGEPVLPATIPPPFREIVHNCLRRDPARRWTVADIRAHLARPSSVPKKPAESAPSQSRPGRPGTVIPEQRNTKRLALPIVLVALGLVAVTAVVKLTGPHQNAPQPAATEMASSTQPVPPAAIPSSPAAAHPSRHAAASSQPAPAPITQAEPESHAPARAPTPGAATKSAVAHEVLPNVSQRALDTITGTLKVRVRIKVDRGGNVTEANLESAGPSPYFARLALAAANGWKFTAEPQPTPTEWRLLFEFRRDGTRAIPTQIR
ncbi:MAG: serine/threonine protein kinase [Terriglobales bacterium]